MNLRPLAFLAISILAASPLHAQRLPNNAHPLHYQLALTPNIAKATFEGTETIDLTLDSPSATVTLNAIELDIHTVKAGTQTATIAYDTTREQATFTFAQPLPAGKSSIAVTFSGILNDKLRGFYLSKTKSRNYAVTQFESTDARRAFPCFDEPAMKAVFDVSLTIDAADTAIANGPIVADKPGPTPGTHTLTFGTTPRMSTYLVAFLVGDFACSKGKSEGIPIRACSTPDKVKLTTFAVQSAEFFLHYYNDYFGIKYPMAKLDLIGIPDFEAGAMENFGAITYRETDLLVDEKEGSINAKKRVANVIAHEMAHQWFGDMVTMQWWDNIWLNEGFATWMQDKSSAAFHPEWGFPQDTASSVQSTLNLDAAHITHPILARDVVTPSQIGELFDGISYGKGGAVLGMVENYLGPELFRQGVHNYLAAHLFANATAEDFWTAQANTSHLPVDKILSSFIVEPGVPLVTFANATGTTYPVTQARFYLAGPTAETNAAARAPGWTIPICLKTDATPVCRVLNPADTTFTIPAGARLPFFYANAGGKGYYRVAYTPQQLKPIIAAAETSLTPPERMSLLGDRWALTRAGQGSVGDFLDLAFALKQDPNASVISSEIGFYNAVSARIAAGDDHARLDKAFRTQFGPVYAALGKPQNGEPYDREEIRSLLFAALGFAQDPAALADAKQLTDSIFSAPTERERKDALLSPLADSAVAVTAAHGDVALYNKLLGVSQTATDNPSLQTQALFTLADFQDPTLVTRTLDYAVSGKVRNQDSWVLIARLLVTPETRDQAWTYVQQNWDKVHAQFTTASGARIVQATGSFCTVKQRDEAKAFFATHKVDAAERTLAQALDTANACIQLRSAQAANLHHWLDSHTN